MKKILLGICVLVLLIGFGMSTQRVHAEEDDCGFLAEEEAIRIGHGFLNDFTQIIRDGSIDQYYGTWAYDVLIDWQKVLNEIGTYYGIKKITAKVDSEKAEIHIVAHGTRGYGVVEFLLYLDQMPEVKVYSKFSLTKWLVDSGVGTILLILNILAVAVLFYLYLKKPKTVAKSEETPADIFAQIVRKEENGSDGAAEDEEGEYEAESDDEDAGADDADVDEDELTSVEDSNDDNSELTLQKI